MVHLIVEASLVHYLRGSLGGSEDKVSACNAETWVRFLGWEDLLEKEMATHSSVLAWRIPWTQDLAGYSPRGCKESDTTERLHFTSLLADWRLREALVLQEESEGRILSSSETSVSFS